MRIFIKRKVYNCFGDYIMENIKWKTVETIMSMYPNGVIVIKEDTEAEFPIASVPFPMGFYREGIQRQRERARLMAAAPELLEKLERLVKVIGPLEGEILQLKYAGIVSAWKRAKELIEYLTDERTVYGNWRL